MDQDDGNAFVGLSHQEIGGGTDLIRHRLHGMAKRAAESVRRAA